MSNPIVTIEMENGKKITAELYPDIAPQSVRNFISLANSGFYNGLIFHRCIYGFMIQGGCPDGTGMGGPGYCIKGEFATNPRNSHVDGALAMARSMDPDSAGSQFYFCLGAQHNLDSGYTVFGTTVEGLDVISQLRAGDEIVHVEIVHE
jgi:peptidyl-prolyl cis-trans isomerase B (cyclophilin B)